MPNPNAELNLTFSALAHPIRRNVLAQLRKGEAPVKDLAESLNISGPALTRHLHVLEQAGLITRGKLAQQRPCRLVAEPLKRIDEWMQTYRQFWEESFDRLEAHLARVKQRPGDQRKGSKNAK